MKYLKHINLSRLFVFFSFLTFFALGNVVYAGFGISPPWIENQHAFPGATFERTITITQEKAPRDLKVAVTVTGADVAKWISVKNGNEFIIPASVTQYQIDFVVQIPQEIPFGFYEGTIDIVAKDPQRGEGQVAIALGAQARVKINVSDEEFSDFRIQETSLPDIEELYSYDITDMTFVEPFLTSQSVGVVAPNLPVGQYWGEIEVYKEGELVLGDRIRFDVFPRWTLEGKPIVRALYDAIFGTTVGIVVFSVLATLIVASGVFFLLIRKMRKK